MTILTTRDRNWIEANEDNFIALDYNDPRAIALRAKQDAAAKVKSRKLAKVREANAAHAAAFEVGQTVISTRGFRVLTGIVEAVNGDRINVRVQVTSSRWDVVGEIATYAASALKVQ